MGKWFSSYSPVRQILLFLALLFPVTSLAQFQVAPAEVSLKVPFGTSAPAQTLRLTNPSQINRWFQVTVSDDSLIGVTPSIGNIEIDPWDLQLTVYTENLFPGEYTANVEIWEAFPARGDRGEVPNLIVAVSVQVYVPGPPEVSDYYIDANYLEETPEGFVIELNSPTTFSVLVAGTPPFSYQWQTSTDGEVFTNLQEGAPFIGTKSNIMTGSAFQSEHAGYYRCLITNSLGATETWAWRLDVPAPPVIVTQPEDVTVTEGDYAEFLTIGNGRPPLNYDWYSQAQPGTELAPANTEIWTTTNWDILSTDSVPLEAAGSYACVVSNQYGSTTTSLAMLDVLPLVAPQFVEHPTSATVPLDGGASLSVAVTGTSPFDYQWEYSIYDTAFSPLEDGPGISGATLPTLTLNNLTFDADGWYRCVVTNRGGSTASNHARVTVESPPEILADPQDSQTPTGETASFFVRARGTYPLSYQWEFASDGRAFAPISDGLRYVGTRSQNLSVYDCDPSVAGAYRCQVSNDFGSLFSGAAQLTTYTPPPELFVAEPERSFFVREGENLPPVSFVLENIGQGTLNFTIATDAADTWIHSVDPASGAITTSPVSVEVSFDTTGLAINVYQAVLTVQSPDLPQDMELFIDITVVDPFAVTNLNDDGPGSLRDAIVRANSTEGPQTITFVVSGTIAPETPLPALSDSTGGTTILGSLDVKLSGHLLKNRADGLVATSAENAIRDLTIVRFPGNGVVFSGAEATGNVVTGCHIGIDDAEDSGNRGSGVLITDGAIGNTVGGSNGTLVNTISGNSFSAITVADADSNSIEGNSIGLPIEGTRPPGNEGHGVHFLPVGSYDNVVGGSTVFERNQNLGNRFYSTSVDVLQGKNIELRAMAQATGSISYQWWKDGVQTATATASYPITAAQKADQGLYFCRASNAAGFDDSDPVYVRVLSRGQLIAISLLPSFAALDVDLDGLLSYGEVAGFATRRLGQASQRAAAFDQADFDEIDTNGDGYLNIDEVIAAHEFDPADLKVNVSPPEVASADQDIDDGNSVPTDIRIENVGFTSLDISTTPTLAGLINEFEVTSDSSETRLGLFDFRALELASNPSILGHRVAYLIVQTDDFLLPTRPVLLSGFGFQTTGELLDQLIGVDPALRQLPEQDVNTDAVFDDADIQTNIQQGH
ncbi:immunoglobulin domain-containing protein [bacterium]|nr:immunoglobulin domain-containing protein [bacterium]